LAQLQFEIQGSYDTHAVQIDSINFSSGTTVEFRGFIATAPWNSGIGMRRGRNCQDRLSAVFENL
jgi:hypothetical protein